MAPPSYKSIPIALLVVFATVVAPNLHQSAAIRAEGAEKAVAATAPSPRRAPIHLEGGMFSHFPCFPFLPKIVRDLCDALFKAPPRECRSPLKKTVVSSCTGYLTNSSVTKPPKACCDDVNSLRRESSFCICHIANGNVGKLLPAPLKRSRAISVLSKCNIGLDANEITYYCIDQADKIPIPPMDPPAPPPPDESDEKKA
ncbi:hypothetical protein QOZ80_7AG0581390 [Eleusine coracana subsp. coracana]|nr:hypothetical protein QOZ80_7AG0581390 [Eleusine coracana subsp. coracana]